MMRVPADSIVVDEAHELGLYAQCVRSTGSADALGGGIGGCGGGTTRQPCTAAQVTAASDYFAMWLPVSAPPTFELADAAVSVRYDPVAVDVASSDESADGTNGAADAGVTSLVAVLAPDSVHREPKQIYEVVVTTSDVEDAGTCACVTMCLNGARGTTGDLPLQGSLGETLLVRGSTATLHYACRPLGHLERLRIFNDGRFASPSWHLSSIEVRELGTGECCRFDANCWVTPSVGLAGPVTSLVPTERWWEDAPPDPGDESAAVIELASRAPS